MTTSHDSFLERAPFINSIASSLRNDILPGSMLFRTIFSLASSKAGNDVSTPERIQIYLENSFSFKDTCNLKISTQIEPKTIYTVHILLYSRCTLKNKYREG